MRHLENVLASRVVEDGDREGLEPRRLCAALLGPAIGLELPADDELVIIVAINDLELRWPGGNEVFLLVFPAGRACGGVIAGDILHQSPGRGAIEAGKDVGIGGP